MTNETRYTPNHGETISMTFPDIKGFTVHAMRVDGALEARLTEEQAWMPGTILIETTGITGTVPVPSDSDEEWPYGEFDGSWIGAGSRLFLTPYGDRWSLLLIRDEIDCTLAPDSAEAPNLTSAQR